MTYPYSPPNAAPRPAPNAKSLFEAASRVSGAPQAAPGINPTVQLGPQPAPAGPSITPPPQPGTAPFSPKPTINPGAAPSAAPASGPSVNVRPQPAAARPGYNPDAIENIKARAAQTRGATPRGAEIPRPPPGASQTWNPSMSKPTLTSRVASAARAGVNAAGTAARAGVNAAGRIVRPLTTVAGKSPWLARAGGALAAANTVSDAANPDATRVYADRLHMQEPTGDGSPGDIARFAGIRTLGAVTDFGDNMTGGLLGRALGWEQMPDQAPVAQASKQAATATPTPPPQQPGNGAPAAVSATPQPALATRTGVPGIVQDGLASFRGTRDTPMPNTQMSPQNATALANLSDNTLPVQADPEKLSPLQDLDRTNASLQNMGFNRAERGKMLDSMGLTSDPKKEGLLAKAGQIGLEQAQANVDKTKGEVVGQQASNQMLEQYLALDDAQDPTGAARQKILNNIALAAGKSPAETPEQKVLIEAIKASADPTGMQTSQEQQNKLRSIMETIRSLSGQSAPVSVDPTQQQPAAAASNPLQVTTPDGQVWNFTNAQEAANFKQKAGAQ